MITARPTFKIVHSITIIQLPFPALSTHPRLILIRLAALDFHSLHSLQKVSILNSLPRPLPHLLLNLPPRVSCLLNTHPNARSLSNRNRTLSLAHLLERSNRRYILGVRRSTDTIEGSKREIKGLFCERDFDIGVGSFKECEFGCTLFGEAAGFFGFS